MSPLAEHSAMPRVLSIVLVVSIFSAVDANNCIDNAVLCESTPKNSGFHFQGFMIPLIIIPCFMILLCFCLCITQRARRPRQLDSRQVAQQLRAQREYENLITATQLQVSSRVETGVPHLPLNPTSYPGAYTSLALSNIDLERGQPLPGVPRGSIEDAHLSIHDSLLRDHSRTSPSHPLPLLPEDDVHVYPPPRTYQGYQSPPPYVR